MPALPQPTLLERAYFAGYFDAEGCLVVGQRHKRFWYTRVSFLQNDPRVIIKLRSIYGGSFHARGRKTAWSLDRFAALACFLEDIRPFVREKSAQVEAVLQRFTSTMPAAVGRALANDLKREKHSVWARPEHAIARKPRATCSRCNCVAVCRGLCGQHYQEARRTGEFVVGPRNKPHAFAYVRQPTPAEIAYLAGYFDGDGHLGMIQGRGDTWHFQIRFQQCCPHGILLAQEIYGGSSRYRPATKKTHRPCLAYSLGQQEAALTFLRDIQPVAIEKRDEIDLALEAFHDPARRDRLADDLKALRRVPEQLPGTVDAQQFVAVLAERLARDPALLVDKSQRLAATAIGWRDEAYAYLVSDRSRRLVESTLQASGTSWVTSPQLLHRALQAGGFLAGSRQARPVINAVLGQGRHRVLKLPLDRLTGAA